MRFGVIRFPGSNCDRDCYYAVVDGLRAEAAYLWHKIPDLQGCDALILPGGFAHGDYLRPGAIARFSPIMEAVIRFAREGGLVIGICNGFQILAECRLLPGALLRNKSLQFICEPVYLKVTHTDSPFTSQCEPGQVLSLPIAHGVGNYYADPEELDRLEAEGRVLFRYCDADGQETELANPNGSLHHIAGILNPEGNVLGLMPHPDRATDPLLGSTDGLLIWRSMQGALAANRRRAEMGR